MKKERVSFGLRRFPLMRLQFIDAMFAEYGFVTRKILMNALGIESAMASRDLAFYSTINDTVYLNHAVKRWTAADDYKPVSGLLTVSASEYLTAAGIVFGFKLGEVPRMGTEFGVIK